MMPRHVSPYAAFMTALFFLLMLAVAAATPPPRRQHHASRYVVNKSPAAVYATRCCRRHRCSAAVFRQLRVIDAAADAAATLLHAAYAGMLLMRGYAHA